MAPPLQAIEGGSRFVTSGGQSNSRKLRLRIVDSVDRFEERLASLWRRYVAASITRAIDSLPTLRKSTPPSQDGRHLRLGARWRGIEPTDERTHKPYISNFIRSSRYTVWDFLPRQLAFQFMKIANFYFLIIAILQFIPGLSPVASYTTAVPLAVFVCFSMAKEGWDDYRRYRMDKVENRSSAWVLDPNHTLKKKSTAGDAKSGSGSESKGKSKRGKTRDRLGDDEARGTELRTISRSESRQHVWTRVQWQHVRVGDIVRLRRDEQVPADMVLLSATGLHGIAYIDTMALDGETNLKSKQACPLLAKRCRTVEEIFDCDATVVSEDPNLDIYSFDGRVMVGEETMPLTMNQVVFRGSTMRNTKEAFGFVVNSGEECKIRMNAHKDVRAKNPAMQAITNRIILLLVVVLVTLACGLKAGNDLFEADYGQRAWYMFGARLTVSEQIFGFIILLNTLIPISLYVSLEIVKIGQFWMLHDIEMYDPVTDTPIVANTTTIIENLGQVSYIFSDKTGTLTENIMRFQKMSAGGYVWHHDEPGKDGKDEKLSARKDRLQTRALLEHVRQHPDSPLSEKALHFVLCMALCNTCLPETKANGEIGFQAASPDELALVQAAKELGYIMVDRDTESITLQYPGAHGVTTTGTYRILDVIDFTSDRKRMTVILRTPDGRVLLLTKGADSALMPRLRLKHLAEKVAVAASRRRSSRRRSGVLSWSSGFEVNFDSPPTAMSGSSGSRSRTTSDFADQHLPADVVMMPDADIFDGCFRHIEDFASEGLRTLLFAYRHVDEGSYKAWKREYHQAETSLVGRTARIDTVAEKIERDLELSGITAIEDKLQEGVPETIDKLRRGNIKVWMLTGDKRETAINIGHSAKICRPFSDIFILDVMDGHIDETMRGVLNEVLDGMVEHSVVVIDGLTMTEVEQSEPSKTLFYDLLTRVDAVICCRASPSQKANVVKCIRARVPSSLTLAIGDGANDIAMIQASHVGVGISGKEGLQAARISDYSIGQFRFLQRLLFVHGRWNYVRTSKYILGTFWKEIVFYLCQAMYQRYNGYTGTSLYESASLTVFNALFTSLAVILMGILEQDLGAETLLEHPELYMYGQRDKGFNFWRYLGWTTIGVAEAAIIWHAILGCYSFAASDDDVTVFAIGNVAFTSVVIFINIKLLLLETHNKTWIILTGFFVSVGGWFLWNIVLAAIYAPSIGPYTVRNSFLQGFGRNWTWWLAVIGSLLAATVLELAVKSLRRVYWPSDQYVMQEYEQKVRKEERRRGELGGGGGGSASP